MLKRLVQDDARRAMLMQIMRFGVTGLFLTALVSIGYDFGVYILHLNPNLSLTIFTALIIIPGYWLHSRVSFAGHGERDNMHIRTMRFAATNLLGFLSNQFFTWLLVFVMSEPRWTPNLAYIFITPVLTFSLNRKWVFA
jgi:putative flippase GtrA